jgi:hypothetical protein
MVRKCLLSLLIGACTVVPRWSTCVAQGLDWRYDGVAQNIEVYSSKGIIVGIEYIRWKLVNRNPYTVTVKFTKQYTGSNGSVSNTNIGEVTIKSGGSAFGNEFAGDLDLSDSPFDVGIKITKWQMTVLSVANDTDHSDAPSGQQRKIVVNDQSREQAEQQRNEEEERRKKEREEEERKKRKEQEDLQARIENQKQTEQQSDEAYQRVAYEIASLFSGDYSAQSWVVNSWGINASVGMGMPWVPLIVDNTSSQNTIAPYSSTDAGAGIGPYLGLEFYPYRGPNFGIGGFVNMKIGWIVGSGATGTATIADYGGTVLLGFKSIKTVWEYSHGKRLAISTFDQDVNSASNGYYSNTGIVATGSADYTYTRTGIGLQFDFSDDDTYNYETRMDKPSDEFTLTAMLLFDRPDFLPSDAKAAQVGRISLKYFLDITFEYSANYPIGGSAGYSLTSPDNKDYFYIGIGKSFTLLGSRY